ncbi:hypothetical protein MPH61_01955, partial [Peribacillus muralis]|uniref:hypothetical protein n=1 Tax=Peribacillus muralis TaxID=264697 RepID=UPI001F4EBA0B
NGFAITYSLENLYLDRFIALQALPFRGRLGSLLGALRLRCLPLNRISRRSVAAFRSIPLCIL